MKLIYYIHKYAGILGIPTYIFFTFMAHLHNNDSYTTLQENLI